MPAARSSPNSPPLVCTPKQTCGVASPPIPEAEIPPGVHPAPHPSPRVPSTLSPVVALPGPVQLLLFQQKAVVCRGGREPPGDDYKYHHAQMFLLGEHSLPFPTGPVGKTILPPLAKGLLPC